MIPGFYDGWIRLHRKMFRPGHPLAPTKKRPAGYWGAWMYLCSMAQWTDGQRFGGVALKRGEFGASMGHLADTWKWSKASVKLYLDALETDTAIRTVTRTKAGTIYRIVEYDTYQCDEDDIRTDTQTGIRTTSERHPNKNEEEKKKELLSLSTRGSVEIPEDPVGLPIALQERVAVADGIDERLVWETFAAYHRLERTVFPTDTELRQQWALWMGRELNRVNGRKQSQKRGGKF